MATTVPYVYRYPFASTWDDGAQPALQLATSLEETSDDLFFDGSIRNPAAIARCLTVLVDIVRTRFYQPFDPIVLDPVVTSGGGMLRFEGFSSCCGVYARADFEASAFDVELRGKGTTNVDFNDRMRLLLRRMQPSETASLQVGGEGVTLRSPTETVIERKVKLPSRWIRGFCEVQAYQPRLVPHFELDRRTARELFRSLPPAAASKRTCHLTRTGRSIRLATRPSRDSVTLSGTERLRVLEPLLRDVKGVRVLYDGEAEVSGWEFSFDFGRFFTLISPRLNRGFSGEGQMLERLAIGRWMDVLPSVADAMQWQSIIRSGSIAQSLNVPEGDIEAALAVLGARGLTGFDVHTERYFHRVLPFEIAKVEGLQPRLSRARTLVDQVHVLRREGDDVECRVPGSEHDHRVRLRPVGDQCTCAWYSRHRGRRGPCAHVLAARLRVDGEEKVAGEVHKTDDASGGSND